MKKFCSSVREHASDAINFENATVNKKRAKITSRCNVMLRFQKKIYLKVC